MIPTPETRKTHTKMIVESSSEYLNKITNSSNISASILVVLTLIIEILTIIKQNYSGFCYLQKIMYFHP